MQTFLPYPDFERSARALDDKRLGKQRVEVLQILRALRGESKGWVNHPATRMWRGHENALVLYGLAVCEEWKRRDFKDTCQDKIRDFWSSEPCEMPSWFGREGFHAAHRAALLHKNFDFYSRHAWQESPATPNEKGSLPYVWPVA